MGIALAACGDGGEPTARPAPTDEASASLDIGSPTGEPGASDEPVGPTDEPAATPTDEPTEAPTDSADPGSSTDPGASPSPGGSAVTGGVASCTGNEDNRAFFASIAAAVDWPVYCALLPAGWFVDGGHYELAGGGWLRISYRGPGGARLEISEGAFCDQGDGCVPAGADSGPAPFGDMTGTMVVADDGRHAIVVDRGEDRSWVVVGSGVDPGRLSALASGFLRIEG